MAFNKKFYAGSFCAYRAQKKGYYDVSGVFRVSTGKRTKSETLVSYTVPQIAFENRPPLTTVAFTQGQLPDYSILPSQVCFVVRSGVNYILFYPNGTIEVRNDGLLDNVNDSSSGKNYYFYMKDGRPLFSLSNNMSDAMYCGRCRVPSHTVQQVYQAHFDAHVAQLSGSDINSVAITSGYIDSLYTLPDQDEREYECDIIMRVQTGASVSGVQKLLKFGGFWFGINEGKFAFAALSSVVNGAAIEADTTYWLRVLQTGYDVYNYTMLYLVDDGTYTLDTLPGVGQWQIGAYGQFAFSAAHDSAMRFGDVGNQWGGTIDLLNCRVYLKYTGTNAWVEVWRPTSLVA